MNVSMNGDVIRVQVPVNQQVVAFYYKKVGFEWVKYKRERVLRVVGSELH
ncbi:MAG: hypothetical protein MI864_25495 [Pseudomonadales bacterium]|nr:hypothetical protein [Oleiphilus messinensis]MCG8613880.1 hypothetical protein [Pseudomonadales bacterium]